MDDSGPHADLETFDAGERGRGVRARRRFARGEIVVRFGGALVPVAELDDFTHTLQVGPGRFLGRSHALDDYVNHSCAPNTALEVVGHAARLRAVTSIAPGDEVTFDYSTCMVDEPVIPGCLCGASGCRGEIAPFPDLPERAAADLERRGLVPEFVRRARHASSGRGLSDGPSGS